MKTVKFAVLIFGPMFLKRFQLISCSKTTNCSMTYVMVAFSVSVGHHPLISQWPSGAQRPVIAPFPARETTPSVQLGWFKSSGLHLILASGSYEEQIIMHNNNNIIIMAIICICTLWKYLSVHVHVHACMMHVMYECEGAHVWCVYNIY